jgi:phospholipase/lecithinase/hemolysin
MKLAELRRTHPRVSITYIDYYGEVLDIVTSPRWYGFNERTVLDACCGGGGLHNANFTVHWTEPGAVQCVDAARYVSWDGLHTTEAVYRIMAHGILDGPFAMPPIMSGFKGLIVAVVHLRMDADQIPSCNASHEIVSS